MAKRWRLKFRGYQHEEILTQTVKTDAEGNAQLNLHAPQEGYYRVAWQSSQKHRRRPKRDRFLPPIKAETAVFVASNRSTDLGYRHSGVGDHRRQRHRPRRTNGAGDAVCSGVATGDRYVLFSVEAEDLFSYRLVHVTGTAKLIELPIEEKHVPNVYLSASDGQRCAVVRGHETDRGSASGAVSVGRCEGRSRTVSAARRGNASITAKDSNGRPVSAEIALGLVDESVKYIQQDYAGDPRQFYYGTQTFADGANSKHFQSEDLHAFGRESERAS